MSLIWLYTLVSVFLVSLASLIGVVTLAVHSEKLKSVLLYLISFSAGTLLGDVFLHILPEMNGRGFGTREGLYVLGGIVVFLILERGILWHHEHNEHDEKVHSVVYLTLIGDSVHNFIDGLVIAGSFLVDMHLGVAATIAVLAHELPHEIGNFAVLVHGGWSRFKALRYNFFSALTAIVGALLVLAFSGFLKETPNLLLAFGAASFLYIALSDLVPELHKERKVAQSIYQLLWFLLGVCLMVVVLWLE